MKDDGHSLTSLTEEGLGAISWEGAAPEALPASPPLLVVEISSSDDRLDVMLQKLERIESGAFSTSG
jgi:hypothetical protein